MSAHCRTRGMPSPQSLQRQQPVRRLTSLTGLTRLKQQVRRTALFAAGVCGAAACLSMAPRAVAADNAAQPRQDIDTLIDQGYDWPERTLEALGRLRDHSPAGSEVHRRALIGLGLVAANHSRLDMAQEVVASITDEIAGNPRLADADRELVRGAIAASRRDGPGAAQAYEAALAAYRDGCAAAPTACLLQPIWRTQYQLALQRNAQGRSGEARQHALDAAERAREGHDPRRQAASLGVAADAASMLGQFDEARRLLAQGLRLAQLDGAPRTLARLRIAEGLVLSRQGDMRAAMHSNKLAHQLARRADAPRLEAVTLANLSDALVKTGQPREALRAIDEALPVVRQYNDRRLEMLLLNNGALAQIALGRTDAGLQSAEAALDAYRAAGALAHQSEALREFADAFAAAGQPARALQMYHRERRLAAELTAIDREHSLAELRKRHDSVAEQRRLVQLARENALVAVQLENHARQQYLWLSGAAVLALGAGLAALLYRRMRAVNRHLAANHAKLHSLSHRDPLTGLANRRGLMAHVRTGYAGGSFNGTLLLADIDHFKQVNDQAGHAGGDLVLVEVARRLAQAVEGAGLVGRWGGEEFLIQLPCDAQQARRLAERLVHGVAATPVALADGRSIAVSVSVGYGTFPLGPALLPMSVDRAINLADMALYIAKSQGRNRAVGVGAVQAFDNAALAAVESDFELACHDNRVRLEVYRGPTPGTEPASVTAADAAPSPRETLPA